MRCDVGLQAPLGWKVVQSLSARRIARIWNMHSMFQFPRSRSRVAKDYKIVWAGLCKAGLRWPGVRAKFEINHEGLKRKFQFNSIFLYRKEDHRSCASVNSSCAQHPPPLPPPRATAGHLPAFSTPGLGIYKFCAVRGPAFANPGAIPELLTRTQFAIRI